MRKPRGRARRGLPRGRLPNVWQPNDDDEDTRAEEHSVGSPENHPAVPYANVGYFGTGAVYGPPGRYRTSDGSQAGWALGSRSDLEGEHDGRQIRSGLRILFHNAIRQ